MNMISLHNLKTFLYDKTGKKHVYTQHNLCYEYQMLKDNKFSILERYFYKITI